VPDPPLANATKEELREIWAAREQNEAKCYSVIVTFSNAGDSETVYRILNTKEIGLSGNFFDIYNIPNAVDEKGLSHPM